MKRADLTQRIQTQNSYKSVFIVDRNCPEFKPKILTESNCFLYYHKRPTG